MVRVSRRRALLLCLLDRPIRSRHNPSVVDVLIPVRRRSRVRRDHLTPVN
jgi:hypothetical protein